MQKVLFIDRDGTLIKEPETDFQVDSLEKLEFIPGVFRNLYTISKKLNYKLVVISNQDGLGTKSFPYEDFKLPHQKFITAFENEGIFFDEILIDPSLPVENSPNRKPGTGMLKKYIEGDYDLGNSVVIGDRISDVELAKNLNAKAILLNGENISSVVTEKDLTDTCMLITDHWDKITEKLVQLSRRSIVARKTSETDIEISLVLDGSGEGDINTGLGFFDHMLEQIKKHGGIDLDVRCTGDLEVDDHHTVEDVAIALGEAMDNALGKKAGIKRYGFTIPMDDSLAQVAIDFGGRSWLVWDADFQREKIGEVSTELFYHFFKSFSDAAKCNLNIEAEGENEHHKIEAIFKAFARALKCAVERKEGDFSVPSSKGKL